MESRGFSGAIQLTGLDDFITPSLACIKPVDSTNNNSSESAQDLEGKPPQKATISLTDCLACAGCVTTAESVLVEAQSSDELRKRFQSKGKVYDVLIVSVSTQSLISLSNKFGLSLSQTSNVIINYFKSLGVDYIYNLKICEDIALQEQSIETILHLSQGNKGPILTSSCPGWICYAEKTHGDWILPYISKVKSPQQIMGALVKSWGANNIYNTESTRICHVTVMPCFDKKLEASRRDFMDSNNIPDVDLVTTSVELEQMILADNFSLHDIPESYAFDKIFESCSNELEVNHGSGSGGFCESIFLDTIKSLFDDNDPSLDYNMRKNLDFMELKYEKNGRKIHFGVANGFRNIQNIVQMLKRKKCDFDFIEIMACPSGCLNGGAQAVPEDIDNKVFISTIKELYNSLPKTRSSNNNSLPKDLYSELKPLFYTNYHAIPKETNGLTIEW
uniref:Probable cytosolic Fe-S cluster assembly factor GL21135 n=1 Tax=Lepeophtheirus salmonis TaxID=72036 RepID=D3PJE9_LEPSM|nr:Probable cytosolic Fe-S cluster assembly factor GL21135 [Lepeophtheirus salmonis]